MRAAIFILLLLSALLSSGAGAQPLAWSVNSDGDGIAPEPDAWQLLSLDMSTQASDLVGQTGFIDIEGLAAHPDGSLYGIDDATKTLVIIDTATGSASSVNGALGNIALSGAQDPAIVFDCSGQLWMATRGTQSLYRVNPANGELDLVGDMGTPITALTATQQGLFGLGPQDAEGFYRIDRSSAAATRIGSLGLGHGYSGAGMSVDDQGRFWAVLDQSNPDADPTLVFRIDPEIGRATLVGETLMGLESLAFPHDQQCATSAGLVRPVPSNDWPGLLVLFSLLLAAGLFVGLGRQR